jgi:hypothetical protein
MARSIFSLAGSIGAYTQHARHGADTAQRARAAFLRRFEIEVDPEGLLSPGERQERAQAALRAHMARLALKSAKVRRRTKPVAKTVANDKNQAA